MLANLVESMKQAAVEAIETAKPVKLVFGLVQSVNPLKIFVDSKILLSEEFLILSRNVTDYELTMDVEHQVGIGVEPYEPPEPKVAVEPAHIHDYTGEKVFKVKNALQEGEKVVMIQMQGGQQYLVLDRV